MGMQKLREVRKAAGLTQVALGQALGTDYRSVQRWESGSVDPAAQTAVRIARVLGCSVEDLYDADPTPA